MKKDNKKKTKYLSPRYEYFGTGAAIIMGYPGQNNEGNDSTCKNMAG